jgi:uncharacterized protein with HEPN domain
MQLESAKLIWDALRASERITSFVDGKSYADYLDDVLLRSAVERQLSILGEAVVQLHRLDHATAERIDDVGQMIAFRNILIHGYTSIRNDIVWEIVQSRVPNLITTLVVLMNEAPDI